MRALSGLLLIITLPTATPAAAQWTNSASKDEMTNEQMVLAISPHATPSRPMELPYTDTDAWVGFMCDGKNEWVYLGFSNTPNLNNTELGDGFNYFSTRLKWGAEIKNARFSQKWGSSFINFSDGRDALKRLTNGSADTCCSSSIGTEMGQCTSGFRSKAQPMPSPRLVRPARSSLTRGPLRSRDT